MIDSMIHFNLISSEDNKRYVSPYYDRQSSKLQDRETVSFFNDHFCVHFEAYTYLFTI